MAKRILAFVLCCCMLFSFTACSDTTWAAKNDKATITSGMYLGFMVGNYMAAIQETNISAYSTLKTKTIDGKNAIDWINEKTLEDCKLYFAIEAKAEEFGIKLTAEDEAEVRSNVDNAWTNYGVYYENNGCSKKSLLEIYTNNFKMEKIFEYFYAEGGVEEVKKEDLKTFFLENLVRVKSIYMPLTNTTTGAKLSEDEIKKVKDDAHKYLERAQNGEDFDALIEEYNKSLTEQEITSDSSSDSSDSSQDVSETTSNTSSEASSDASDSSGSEDEKDKELDDGLGENDLIIEKSNTSFPEAFVTGVFEMKVGEYKIITTDAYVFVVSKLDIGENEKTFEYYKKSVLSLMKEDDFKAKLDSFKTAITFETNEDSFKRYVPKKLKF